MSIRSFSLNSDEAYEALCRPPDPWRWGPGLPRDPSGALDLDQLPYPSLCADRRDRDTGAGPEVEIDDTAPLDPRAQQA